MLSNRGAEIPSPVAPQECRHTGEYVEFLRSRWAKEARFLDRNDFFNGLLERTHLPAARYPFADPPLSVVSPASSSGATFPPTVKLVIEIDARSNASLNAVIGSPSSTTPRV